MIERFIGIFMRPKETFREINDRPDFLGFWASTFASVFVAFVSGFVSGSKIRLINETEPNLSIIAISGVYNALSTLVLFLFGWVLITILFWIGVNLLGEKANLKAFAAIFGYIKIADTLTQFATVVQAFFIIPTQINYSLSEPDLVQLFAELTEFFVGLYEPLIVVIAGFIAGIVVIGLGFGVLSYITELNTAKKVIISLFMLLIHLIEYIGYLVT